jgi:hypothetical protein
MAFIPALPPLATTFCRDPARFLGLQTLSINETIYLLRSPFPGLPTCVRSRPLVPPRPTGLGCLSLVESFPALSRVVVPSFSLSRFHLPASLDSTGITPLLRYYGGSVTSRAQFFGLSIDHERCFLSRFVIPDSYRSNFRPFYLQPPEAFLSFCSLLFPGIGRGIVAPPLRDGFRSWLRHRKGGSPMHLAESSSTLLSLWTGLSLPVALHPASHDAVAFSYGQASVPVRKGLSPFCWCVLSGAPFPGTSCQATIGVVPTGCASRHFATASSSARRLFDRRPEEADLSDGSHELEKIDGLPKVGAEAAFIKMD